MLNKQGTKEKSTNIIIFAPMATKLKKKKKTSPEKKPAKSDLKALKADKEEKIDWKALARDERTWKIIGAIAMLVSVFLFISFISYLFTWKEDQKKVRWCNKK